MNSVAGIGHLFVSPIYDGSPQRDVWREPQRLERQFEQEGRMTAWGSGAFENDIATDWLQDLAESDPTAFFLHCLDLSNQNDGLDHVACVGVVCTARMIDAMVSGEHAGLPDAATTWLQENGSLSVARLLGPALASLCRVLGRESELRQVWEDDGDRYLPWLHVQMNQLDRLAILLAEPVQNGRRRK